MSTLVLFHAHPDDEVLLTGGTMARAHAEGHRVVLVVATDGDHGEVPGDLADGERLADRRRTETERAAAILGVDRVEFLGYTDSGMTGWDGNDQPGAFCRADVDEAASRLADLLRAERADVFTIYDWHGGYGHPDHIQVHRVGCRAVELVAPDLPEIRVFEATLNRDAMRSGVALARRQGIALGPDDHGGGGFDPDAPMDDGNPMGTPEAELTLAIDVVDHVATKRAALRAHASQVSDTSFFNAIPDREFALVFGTEYYTELGRPPGLEHGWFFDRRDDRERHDEA